ncbi:TRAP transporter TatT component family protein [Sulfurirhabdus autotrophica]|uniref:TRAP transporter TatT component family protein n=1 Tax=Sulfurirhabdus autotrophica TaxID=1706046 RepID=A0A4R3XTV7_9PROT|nr:TRAP transporter TatT component family protein [Sulfurirhabdus autotrophica]TCV82342.1 TRAP transporter TatT component family protein [Sulfurirhabdus autotrophica]
MNMHFSRLLTVSLCALLLNACSMGQIVARSTVSIMDSGVIAMNHETDLELAKAAIPANIKLVEGMIQEVPTNRELRIYAAQGFYGYAFGFVEDENHERASSLYQRGLKHAFAALATFGLKGDIQSMRNDTLQQNISHLDSNAVPALFWAASNWAKLIDLNRDDPSRIAELSKVSSLMQRVIELDENYYYGGPQLFFGVWHGSRPPMLGGDFALSEKHFKKARDLTQGKLLIVDLLYAQYLSVQQADRKTFHDKLTAIVNAPPDIFPEMALVNAISQRKARLLLTKEGELF